MPKHIVLCSDGTGNTPGKGRGTNVWKLYQAVDRHDHEEQNDRPQQVAFYDDGVGTGGLRLVELAGGAFGLGLSRNVRELYASLVVNYEPVDKVFLFGFSRGAFTARSLAGMICRCGLLGREDYLGRGIKEREKLLRQILRAYRSEDVDAGKKIRERLGLRPISIEFVGVWDTVDAVGLPFDELKIIDRIWRALFGLRLWGFHDRVLSSKVTRGCQALAIDDERRTFHPNVWEPREGIEQVWFAGVHSNVGGGNPKEGLANIARYWMLRQAEDAGLRFVPGAITTAHDEANAHAKLYDSRAGLAVYHRYAPRNIDALCATGPVKVHATALDRIRWGTDGYAPTNLPERFEVVDPDARMKAGVRQRVAEYQASVDRSASTRRAERPRTEGLSRSRVRLYYVFLVATWVLVLTLAALAWEWAWALGLLARLSDTLEPLLGVANPLVTLIVRNAGTVLSGTVGLVLPGFLANPIRSLETIPEIVTVFVALGALLFWRRKVLARRVQEHGQKMWLNAFNPELEPRAST